MGQINVQINGRSHTVACDDGQEEHLTELAQFVATQAEKLAGSLGQVPDSRLLLMTALVVADELGEALDRAEAMEKELEVLRSAKRPLMSGQPAEGAGEGATAQDTAQLIEILDRAATRVEDIAARVANV
jgi:cell division protein ZapA